MAERVATVSDSATILPVLALLNMVCAWQVRPLAQPLDQSGAPERLVELSPEFGCGTRMSGSACSPAPYLRNLAVLVMLGTIGGALVDYLFKAAGCRDVDRSDDLLRLFRDLLRERRPRHVRGADGSASRSR